MGFPPASVVRQKRIFNPDEDDELAAPTQSQPQGSQQNQSKRRRTSDEQRAEPQARPTMAPPIRNSNIRKA